MLWGLERLLSGKDHWLLLQRTWVQFSTSSHTGGSQLSIAPVSGDPAFSLVSEGTSCTWCTLIYRLQGKHPYTQNINKSFLKIMPWFTQDLYFFLLRFCMCFKSDYNRHNTRSATKNQVGHGGKYCNARDRGRKI